MGVAEGGGGKGFYEVGCICSHIFNDSSDPLIC